MYFLASSFLATVQLLTIRSLQIVYFLLIKIFAHNKITRPHYLDRVVSRPWGLFWPQKTYYLDQVEHLNHIILTKEHLCHKKEREEEEKRKRRQKKKNKTRYNSALRSYQTLTLRQSMKLRVSSSPMLVECMISIYYISSLLEDQGSSLCGFLRWCTLCYTCSKEQMDAT